MILEDVKASKDADLAAPGPAHPTAGGSAGGVVSGLSWIDRLLPVWIIGAMVVGVLMGYFAPQVGS